MKNKNHSFLKNILVSSILFFVSNLSFSAASISEDYPFYTNASSISTSAQIPLLARWLHLISLQNAGITIPKSFDSGMYWTYLADHHLAYQLYRKTNDNGTCQVLSNQSNDATIERALQQQGLDIYDGAVWQMAMSLVAKDNLLYLQDVEQYQNFLMNGLSGGFLSYYAYKNYHYNGKTMPSEKNAYLLKFVSPTWAFNYDVLNQCNMEWPEWSAVTGEEAWAVLLGPIQSIYLLNDGKHNPNWSSQSQADDYLILGHRALDAFLAMQAPSGGVYRNVAMPGKPQDLDISLENNFSLYAGLSLFEKALKARDVIYRQQIYFDQKKGKIKRRILQTLNADIDDINKINLLKQGLVRFFSGQGGVTVFDQEGKYFYASVSGETANKKDFAVDVQTWGAAVIATDQKDDHDENEPSLLNAMINTYGKEVMFNMFEAAFDKASYYGTDNQLLGLGYTAQKPTDPFYVLSGEWSLGAVNTAMVLARYYQNDPEKVSLLIAQAKNILRGVIAETTNLQGEAHSGTAKLSYLYANKRTFIPFGWFSNKMPSTASTAWALMVNRCFNPFELGGGDYQSICNQIQQK